VAGKISDGDSDAITDINVTPFVDVVLVLLIIFMATASYIAQQAIQIQLPKAASGDSVQSKNLAFVLNKDSELFFDGQPVTIEEVAGRIAAERAKDSTVQLQALISADQATPHGAVVKLIDTVRKNGITDLAINVEVEAAVTQ
jgi:biopolymer transport protein ExbD